MTDITFKLPPQILDKHGDELRAVDWMSAERHTIKLGGREWQFEVIIRDFQTVVRSASARQMIALRRYAQSIAPDPVPTPEELASVLEQRNKVENQDAEEGQHADTRDDLA